VNKVLDSEGSFEVARQFVTIGFDLGQQRYRLAMILSARPTADPRTTDSVGRGNRGQHGTGARCFALGVRFPGLI
jgi:hypothetical protein